jgi:hypothetical protein
MLAAISGAAWISLFDIRDEAEDGDERAPSTVAPTLLFDLDLLVMPTLSEQNPARVRAWWNDWGAAISEIIRERHERGQQTIVTMALDRATIAGGFGRSVSAIVFGGTVIELDWSYDWTRRSDRFVSR